MRRKGWGEPGRPLNDSIPKAEDGEVGHFPTSLKKKSADTSIYRMLGRSCMLNGTTDTLNL